MTSTPRARFSTRAGLTEAPEDDGPFENVPEHLLGPLQGWVGDALRGTQSEERALRICLRLRIPPLKDPYGNPQYAKRLRQAGSALLLDVVDEVLHTTGIADDYDVRTLRTLLDEAGSAYRVNDAGDGLEERVTPTVRGAVRHTLDEAADASSAGSAAHHLAIAWQAAYGRGPDPVRAYSESIKAVESAAHAVIQPNNAKATLGTMLGEFKNARHKFDTAIPAPGGDPIAPVEAMMRALWDGQTSRHGGRTPTSPETLEAARAGVHLAAALVHWFISGAVVRLPRHVSGKPLGPPRRNSHGEVFKTVTGRSPGAARSPLSQRPLPAALSARSPNSPSATSSSATAVPCSSMTSASSGSHGASVMRPGWGPCGVRVTASR
jgi:hypothetical protein